MTGRDFAAEMRAVIDAETAGGPFVAAIVATHIVEKLRATDRALLAGWLDANAEQFLREAIGTIDRSCRRRAHATAGARRFAAASDAAEAGDTSELAEFLDLRYVIEDGSRKRLADLVKADLLFVASTYDRRAAENTMNAAFLRALAKRVGGGCVADHFDDEQLAAMWQSVGGR